MKGRWGGMGLAAPAVLFLVFTLVIPLALLIPFGFREMQIQDWVIVSSRLTLRFVGEVMGDPYTYTIFWRSFYIAVAVTLLCIVLAYPIAYVYTLVGRLGRQAILIAIIAPMLTSAIVRTYAWLIILGGRNGLLNKTLMALDWIEQPLRIINTPWAILIGLTQLHLPMMAVPLIAVLAGRDKRVEQASLNLGASHVATFFRVTLPISLPGVGAGSVLVFSLSYTTFVPPQLLGGGNYTNAATTVYEQIIHLLDWSKGGVVALLLLTTCLAAVGAITLATNVATRWAEARR